MQYLEESLALPLRAVLAHMQERIVNRNEHVGAWQAVLHGLPEYPAA